MNTWRGGLGGFLQSAVGFSSSKKENEGSFLCLMGETQKSGFYVGLLLWACCHTLYCRVRINP